MLDRGFFNQLKTDDGDALVVGIMTDRRGVPARKALYVVAAEDPWDESPKVRTVSFEGAGKVTAFAAAMVRHQPSAASSSPSGDNLDTVGTL